MRSLDRAAGMPASAGAKAAETGGVRGRPPGRRQRGLAGTAKHAYGTARRSWRRVPGDTNPVDARVPGTIGACSGSAGRTNDMRLNQRFTHRLAGLALLLATTQACGPVASPPPEPDRASLGTVGVYSVGA